MIITDKFVYIHLPKTGGTFVEKIIEKVYRNMGITRHLSFMRYFFNSKKLYFVRRHTLEKVLKKLPVGEKPHGYDLKMPSGKVHKLILK